jgi:hypothetical protein
MELYPMSSIRRNIMFGFPAPPFFEVEVEGRSLLDVIEKPLVLLLLSWGLTISTKPKANMATEATKITRNDEEYFFITSSSRSSS